MRKQLQIVGVFLLSLTSLNASAMLGAKPSGRAENGAPPPPSAEEMHPYVPGTKGPEDQAWFLQASYWGGWVGPVGLTVAQKGVPNTRTGTVDKEAYVRANLEYTNGVRVQAGYSVSPIDGPLFLADYFFAKNTSQKSDGEVPNITNPSMTTTRSFNRTDGTTAQIYKAEAKYSNNGFHFVNLAVGRTMLKQGSTCFFILPGVSFTALDHSFVTTYFTNSGGVSVRNITKKTEQRTAGGATVTFMGIKSFAQNCGIMAKFSSYAHASHHSMGAKETQIDSAGTNTGVHSGGNVLSMSQGFDLAMQAYYQRTLDSGKQVSGFFGWNVGGVPAGTMVGSQAFGQSTNMTQPLVFGGVELGMGLAF